MMIVVPAIPQRNQTEDEVVPALISDIVRTTAPQVANGVHRKWNLKDNKMAEQAAPEETDQCIVCSASHDKADEPG